MLTHYLFVINVIAAKAHQRANAILHCFLSKNINMLERGKRGFLVYVRSLLEYNSVIWSPSYVQDIDTVERVQRKFTKRLPRFKKLSFMERLHLLDLPSPVLNYAVCTLHIDLIWCYKIIFGLVHINCEEFFRFNKKSTGVTVTSSANRPTILIHVFLSLGSIL